MKLNPKLVADIDEFCNHIDVEFEENFIKEYLEFGNNDLYGGVQAGSDAEHECAAYIAKTMKVIGLKNVELIPTPTDKYQFNDATITIVSDVEEKNSIEIKPYPIESPGTSPEGITAELIEVGHSTVSDYEGIDVTGKIVLVEAIGVADSTTQTCQYNEAVQHGAVAVLYYFTEDILDDDTLKVFPTDMKCPVPFVALSKNQVKELKGLIQKYDDIKINLTVDAEYIEDGGTTYSVCGEIPGKYTDERIFYTSHLDHYFRCINDNISSCANILGIAKAMLDSGYEPNRTITIVMHGSHEFGNMNSKYPYISGAFKVIRWRNPDWQTKGLVDINFEAASIIANEMRSMTSYGNDKSMKGFFAYAPKMGKGYKSIAEDVRMSDYYYFSWMDTISYLSMGCPVVENDNFTEAYAAILSENGAGGTEWRFAGRDHSNKDNWDADSYSRDHLEETTKFYGAYGLYVDSVPYFEMDFSSQADRLLSESDYNLMRKHGMKVDKHKELAERLNETSKKVAKKIDLLNSEYFKMFESGMDKKTKQSCFVEAQKFNAITHKVFGILGKVDKIGPWDWIVLGNAKCMQNVAYMDAAIDLLKKGLPKQAYEDNLKNIDLVAMSQNFSKDTVTHMQKITNDPDFALKRFWANGMELSCITMFDIVQLLKDRLSENGGNFTEEIKMIKKERTAEINTARYCIGQEATAIREAVEIMEYCCLR